MSALVYSVEDILIGKYYSGSRGDGLIISADKRDGVYYDECDTYLVKVRPQFEAGMPLMSDFYATIAVAR